MLNAAYWLIAPFSSPTTLEPKHGIGKGSLFPDTMHHKRSSLLLDIASDAVAGYKEEYGWRATNSPAPDPYARSPYIGHAVWNRGLPLLDTKMPIR